MLPWSLTVTNDCDTVERNTAMTATDQPDIDSGIICTSCSCMKPSFAIDRIWLHLSICVLPYYHPTILDS